MPYMYQTPDDTTKAGPFCSRLTVVDGLQEHSGKKTSMPRSVPHLGVFLALGPVPGGGCALEPGLEAGAAVCHQRVLTEVEPVLNGAPVPPPLARPVQAHVLAPARHLHTFELHSIGTAITQT